MGEHLRLKFYNDIGLHNQILMDALVAIFSVDKIPCMFAFIGTRVLGAFCVKKTKH